MQRLRWNFDVLKRGTGATEGFYKETFAPNTSQAALAGEPLLGGKWKAVFIGTTGDYKGRMELSGFHRYYRCACLCESCKALQPTKKSNKELTCYDFNHGAAWEKTIVRTNAELLASEKQPIPPAQLEGWSKDSAFRDPFHTHELGGGRDSCGSGLASMLDMELLKKPGTNLTPNEQLAGFHDEMCTWALKNSLKINAPTLSLRSIGRGDSTLQYPEISSIWKAASIKVLIFFMAVKSEQLCTTGHYQKLIATHLWSLAEYLWVCGISGLEFDDQQRRRAMHAGRIYLLTLQSLNVIAKEEGLWLWRVRPKNHYFCHTLLELQSSAINPKIFSTAAKESFLFKLKRIGQSCHTHTVGDQVLKKYWIYMQHRIRVRQKTGRLRLTQRILKAKLS